MGSVLIWGLVCGIVGWAWSNPIGVLPVLGHGESGLVAFPKYVLPSDSSPAIEVQANKGLTTTDTNGKLFWGWSNLVGDLIYVVARRDQPKLMPLIRIYSLGTHVGQTVSQLCHQEYLNFGSRCVPKVLNLEKEESCSADNLYGGLPYCQVSTLSIHHILFSDSDALLILQNYLVRLLPSCLHVIGLLRQGLLHCGYLGIERASLSLQGLFTRAHDAQLITHRVSLFPHCLPLLTIDDQLKTNDYQCQDTQYGGSTEFDALGHIRMTEANDNHARDCDSPTNSNPPQYSAWHSVGFDIGLAGAAIGVFIMFHSVYRYWRSENNRSNRNNN